MTSDNREIEVRFLEIDVNQLIAKLRELGAEDRGEDMLLDIIAYDKDKTWLIEKKRFIRIRRDKHGAILTYKNHFEDSATGTTEIEFGISDVEKAKAFLTELGFPPVREQEKKRHTFQLGDVTVDIDTWPKIPTYVELEGPSEQSLKDAATKLNLDWSTAVFKNAGAVIADIYHIPVHTLKYFTFDRME